MASICSGVRGRHADALDQFFTKDVVANECVQVLIKMCPLYSFDLLVEPSFGTGTFVHSLVEHGASLQKLIYVDIDAVDKIVRKNFIREDIVPPEFYHCSSKRCTHHCLVIGNPPFGKNASLAIAFFNRAALFATVIAFIVPRTFRKDSVQNKLDRHFVLIDEHALPCDAFVFEDKPRDVPSVFQIWMHVSQKQYVHTDMLDKHGLRLIRRKMLSCPDFTFVTSLNDPDIAIRRVGVNAGKIFTDSPSTCSDQSHFFLKLTVPSQRDTVIATLRSLNLEKCSCKYDTAGCPSLSKTEICKMYFKSDRS